MKIKKAIIPAAGLGTRLLPATKAIPKEMLTIVDKPVIQHVVEEAVAAGITDILIIISKGKESIKHHFKSDPERIESLRAKGNNDLADQLIKIDKLANISFTYQHPLNGLGDAILYGKSFVGADPFAILLGDSIMHSDGPANVLSQLIQVAEKVNTSVVAVSEIEKSEVYKYGVLNGIVSDSPDVLKVMDWIEKPSIEEATSNIVISGLYILTPQIMDCLEHTERGYGNEIQLTDAMRLLLKKESMHAYLFNGTRFDVGNKLDFIKTNIFKGLEDNEIAEELKNWMSKVLS